MLCISRVCLAISITLAALSTAACSLLAQSALRPAARGAVIRVDTLEGKTRMQLTSAIAFLPRTIPVRGNVQLYRVLYGTVLHGRPTSASGLLVVPQDRSECRGVVAFLHGTNVTRALAPSQPDRVDGNEEAAVFGGNGYCVVLPDYIGLGLSTERQPYMLAEPQVDATIDLLSAVRKVMSDMQIRRNPSLMLMGFSQGGHSVAAVQRAIEEHALDGYRLRGSVAIAGAYALRRVSLPYALEKQNVGYLTLVLASYAAFYGHALTEVFVPSVAAALPALLDGTHQMEEIGPMLRSGIAGVFQPAFLRELEGNRNSWFTAVLDANSVASWVPKVPMRLYNGSADDVVSPRDAAAFFAFAHARGGRVSLHSLGAVSHAESSARAYAPVLRWFDSLTASSGLRDSVRVRER